MLLRRDLLTAAGLASAALAAPALAQPGRDRLRSVMREAVPNIDPYQNPQRTGLVIAHMVWDTLVHRNPDTFAHEPLLATAWRWIDDTTLEMTIREGVTFHNGDRFGADDVVYTINKISAPDARLAVPGNVSWLKGAEKTGPNTVRLLAKNAFPAALDYLALTIPMLPKDYYERVGADGFARAPIGSGPYRITRLEAGKQVEMERYDGYYADSPKGRPGIREVSIRFVPDGATEVTELLSGQSDFIWRIAKDQTDNLARMPNLATLRVPSMRLSYLSIDAAGRSGADNPLTKLPVRQAIFHAIDRATMAARLIGPGSSAIVTPCVPSQFGCDTAAAVVHDYNPDKAKALLAEAGYPDGFDTELVSPVEPSIGASLQAYLRVVGIRARVSQMQAAAAIRRSWAGESPLYTGSWGSYSINDVSAILPVMFGGGGDDYARDPELTQWIREGGSTSDADLRRRAYSAAIRRITERALWMPLYNQVTNYAFNRRLSFTAQADELPRLYLAKWS